MIIGFPITKADYSGARLSPKLVPLTFIKMMNGQDAYHGSKYVDILVVEFDYMLSVRLGSGVDG
jgi:hypothetical protein